MDRRDFLAATAAGAAGVAKRQLLKRAAALPHRRVAEVGLVAARGLRRVIEVSGGP